MGRGLLAGLMVVMLCFGGIAYGTSLKTGGSLQHFLRHKVATRAIAGIMMLGATFGGISAVSAGVEPQDAVDWQQVDANSEAYLHNSMYLLGNDVETGEPALMPVLYVGENSAGNSLLLGAWLEDLPEMGAIELYGYDGRIGSDVELVEHKFFHNDLSHDDNFQIYALQGVNLSDSYSAAKLENYPFTKVGRPLQLATFGLSAEAIADYANLPLNTRSCSSVESLGWARIGYGLNTCAADGEIFGSTIYNPKTGNAMGIWAGNGRDHLLVLEYLDAVIEDVNSMQSLDVSASGKLPTIWAALKVRD
ncbi:MAG: hypothetical protein OYH77_06115 [Pseudomonadota bacterium]|nr:hypothetical protein [Pseudomonadota bacterium]